MRVLLIYTSAIGQTTVIGIPTLNTLIFVLSFRSYLKVLIHFHVFILQRTSITYITTVIVIIVQRYAFISLETYFLHYVAEVLVKWTLL
jgi:hypothetical protein